MNLLNKLSACGVAFLSLCVWSGHRIMLATLLNVQRLMSSAFNVVMPKVVNGPRGWYWPSARGVWIIYSSLGLFIHEPTWKNIKLQVGTHYSELIRQKGPEFELSKGVRCHLCTVLPFCQTESFSMAKWQCLLFIGLLDGLVAQRFCVSQSSIFYLPSYSEYSPQCMHL